MVLKLKKRYILFLCFVLILFIIFNLICASNCVVNSLPVKDRTIIIDAGHGGIDGGAKSKDGISEKNINLAIAKHLKKYLEQSGAKVIMTREEDISLHKSDEASIRNKKRSDLNTRHEMVNNSNADIFISIHLNYFEQSKYKGAQVFYENNNMESVKLATEIQRNMVQILDKNNKRIPAKIASNKILFQNLKVPAVIAECGFLSNPDEAKLLSTKEYQQKTAFSIYMGILNYFST